MARYKLVYRGPEIFTILDLEKPQKGHPKDTWVPNGLPIHTFSSLDKATEELNKLNGPKRKSKKQKPYQKRGFKYNKRMGTSPTMDRPKTS